MLDGLLLLVWTRSSRILTSRRRSVWRNRKSRKMIGFFEEDRSLTWCTSTFESLALITQHWILRIYSLSLFATTRFRTSIQYLTKFVVYDQDPIGWCSRSLYKLRMRKFDQLKTVLKLYDMEIHQKISLPNCQKLKTMVKRSMDQKLRLRVSDARNERIETWAVVARRRRLSGIEREQGVFDQWKAKGQCSRGDKCSFQHDSDERAKSTQKKPLHILSHQHKEVEVRRERGASEAGVCLGSPTDSRAKTSWKVTGTKSLCEYWHPPECRFCEMCATVGLCISGHWAARFCNDFLEGHTVLGPIRRARFTSCAASSKHPRQHLSTSLCSWKCEKHWENTVIHWRRLRWQSCQTKSRTFEVPQGLIQESE